MEHTKEPWGIDQYHNFVTPDGVLYLGGVTTPCPLGDNMRKGWGNARRIVACVNACAGIPTAELETAGRLSNAEESTLRRLKKQRDELLAALKLILENDGGSGSKCFDAFKLYDARLAGFAAIASVKGQ